MSNTSQSFNHFLRERGADWDVRSILYHIARSVKYINFSIRAGNTGGAGTENASGESQIAMEGIGRKFQKPTVFEAQTVRQNLAMALKTPRGPFAVLMHKRTAPNATRIEEIASEIGLLGNLRRMAGELSHGQKQWLEIGMLLAQDPRLLLVDEPAAGMTVEEREKTTDILKRAAKTRAVVVVEHDMEFVRRLDCKVTVLHEGAVLAEGSLDHVTSNQTVIDVYLGRAHA